MTKCTYCGRTDRACQNDAQVIGCDPMPAVEPTPRQRLAEAIQTYRDAFGPKCRTIMLPMEDARAVLAALQEADRREMQATIDGDMP